VHLPFRSLVIPYFNFGGPDVINRSLLRNIIGRVGRAEANLRATIVFLEPGRGSKVLTYFYNELIAGLDHEVGVESALPALANATGTLDHFESVLRLESQILGVVQDATFMPNQPVEFAQSTFAAQSHRDTMVNLLCNRFTEMERRDPPLLARASPYSLTGFGRAAAVSGISDSSARVIIRELDHLFVTNAAWFDTKSWLLRPVADELIDNIADLIVTPFEFFQRTSHGQVRRMETVTRAREWFKRRDPAWISLTRPDRFIFVNWIKGLRLEDILKEAKEQGVGPYPFDADHEDLGLAQLHEYLEETREYSLWMLSAAIRLSEQYCRELNVIPQPIFRKAVPLLERGVASDVALRLLDFGVPRAIVTRIAPDLYHLAEEEDEVLVPATRNAILRLMEGDASLEIALRAIAQSLK
jgi:hypothetical protein